MPLALAANPRTATKAAIKRASARARADMNKLDARVLGELDAMYRRAAENLQADILGYAAGDGSLRLEVLQDLLGQVNGRLRELADLRDRLLDANLVEAAQIGVAPFAGTASVVGDVNRIAHEAAQFVRAFQAADGLQLSDRLWRIDQGARDQIGQAIQTAVIQGHSASRAASDFLGRGQAVPPEIAAQIGQAQASGVAQRTGRALLRDEGNARDKALRVFRTELNRAHGEAYQAAAFEHPDVIGTRFLLSPRHPEADICDMHASVNRYGLGKGVYPKGKNPWPAHPNTLSYTEVVFEDEVTDEDRAGKEDRISWLKAQPPSVQDSVLGSRKKRAALQRGILTEGQIATPWKVLEARYQRAGLGVDDMVPAPAPDLPGGTGKERLRNPEEVRTDALRYVIDRGEATGFEHAVVYDVRDGTEYVRKTTRSKNSVSFTRQEIAVFSNPKRRLDLVHNHPSGMSLSPADLRMGTLPGIERVTAYGHDGSLYSARSLADAEAITAASKVLDRLVQDHVYPLYTAGQLSISQASAMHWHLHNLAMDRLGLIEYSAERIRGLLQQTLGALETGLPGEILDKVVRAAKEALK